MAKAELKTKQKTEVEDRSSLKGTMASVFFLGAIIIVTWVGVYYLFAERFYVSKGERLCTCINLKKYG